MLLENDCTVPKVRWLALNVGVCERLGRIGRTLQDRTDGRSAPYGTAKCDGNAIKV